MAQAPRPALSSPGPVGSARRSLAIAAGKASSLATRALGRGGGTALPGLVAERIDSSLVASIVAQAGQGTVLVSGTNGKTTTALMISEIVRAASYQPLHNHAGSNLMRGIAATLVREASLSGRLPAAEQRLAVLELDEAALPLAAAATNPRAVVLLNLFRDQLDRYGEVDIVADRWREMVGSLSPETTLVLNADDPAVAAIGGAASGDVVFFGLDAPDRAGHQEHAADVRWCPRCGAEFDYSPAYYGHIGNWRCPACGNQRPQPQVVATGVTSAGFELTQICLTTPAGSLKVKLGLGGLYNVYNAAAAAAAAVALNLPLSAVEEGLARTRPAFGRQERFEVDGRTVVVLLGKNPAGFNQLLHTLAEVPGEKHMALFLNDGIADGRDVSWIWDVDFELLKGQVASAIVSGRRATDLALRLRYGEIIAEPAIEEDEVKGFEAALAQTPVGQTLYLLPTYTAMLRVREAVARRAHARSYWESN
jgi:UDP-N-acetylmuramyl tripeptide synthase